MRSAELQRIATSDICDRDMRIALIMGDQDWDTFIRVEFRTLAVVMIKVFLPSWQPAHRLSMQGLKQVTGTCRLRPSLQVWVTKHLCSNSTTSSYWTGLSHISANSCLFRCKLILQIMPNDFSFLLIGGITTNSRGSKVQLIREVD